jgi:arsenate reductase
VRPTSGGGSSRILVIPAKAGIQYRAAPADEQVWDMKVTIYHNPSCSNSRKALEIIREKGIAPEIVEYLKTPLDPHELRHLIGQMKVTVRDVMRTQEPVYAEMKLDGADDDTLLAAMAAHPILLNSPIVVTDRGAKLCRPGETVGELI